MDAEVEDGSSVEKAIVVQRVSEEYTWMRNNLPAFRMRSQSLIMRDGKMYDEMTLQSSEGEERKVFFDVTAGFGKI